MATTAAVLSIMVKANTGQATAGLRKTDQQLHRTSKATMNLQKGFSRAAKGALGLAAAYTGIAGAKKAVSTTEDLAKTTLSLNRNLGLSVKTSSELGAVLKARGADTKQVNMAFAAFSRNVEGAKKGTASAVDAFKALGVSQRELQSGSPEKMLNAVADGMERLGPGTERTAVTAKLFGRGWQTLGPILRGGSAALQEQLALADKYGASFGGKSVKEMEKFIQAQREAKIASMGLQVAFGTQVAPALTKAITTVTGAIADMRNGTGSLGKATQTYTGIVKTNWAAAANVFRSVSAAITGFMSRNRSDIRQFGQAMTNVFNVVRAVAARTWPGIRQIVQGALRGIGGFIKIFSGVFTGDFRKMWDGVKQVFSGSLKAIGGIIRAQTAPMRAAAAAVFGGVRNAISSAMRGALKIMGDVIAGMLRRFESLFNVASKIPGIGGKFRGVRDAAKDAADRVDRLGESTRKLPSKKQVKVSLKMVLAGTQDVPIPGLAQGGSGGPAYGGMIQKAAQHYAKSKRNKLAQLFSGETGVLGTAKGSLGKYEAIGHKFGLRTTSGHRPWDRDSLHGANRARDLSNGVNTPEMLRYARYMARTYGSKLLELIHTPLGYGIKDGRRVPLSFWGARTNAMHHNHVHVAAQRGAMVPGSGSGDKVRAMLEPGEGIINKRAVKAMGGAGAINAINRAVPRFQKGGLVDSARKYFKGNTLRTMIAVALAESGGRRTAHNTKGEDSRGPWQINVGPGANTDLRGMPLFTYAGNAKAARIVLNRQGFNAWTMYRNRTYLQYLDDATRMLKGGGGGRSAPKKKLMRRVLPNGDVLIGGRRTSELIATDVTGGRNLKGQRLPTTRPPRLISPVTDFPEGGEAGEDPRVAAMNAHTEAVRASAEESARLRGVLAEQNRIASSTVAIGLREAQRALADMIAGQLGTMAGQRMAGPSTGQLARF